METIEKATLSSLNITEYQLEKLKAIFPEIFTEGSKIDFEKLRLTLGKNVDVGKERYGMNWPGKADCFKTIQQPSRATLVPDRDGSINFDATKNLFIEGDNLEVLKLLQKSYLGKVKMIYIDPPYNTGNEFIYPDNYSESLDTYLEYTGQKDNEGRKFSTNTETDGRFHSKWLNMMYPRLFLAKNLLREDGVIFISINDAEVHNLKAVCNEIFGEENFVAQITWKARVKPVNIGDAKYRPQKEIEYILCYQKNYVPGVFQPLLTGGVRSYPNQLGNRNYRLATILKSNRGVNFRSTMTFDLNGYVPPEGQRWQAGEDVIRQLNDDGYIEFKEGTPFRRYFEDEEGAEHDPFYCFMEVDWSSTSEVGKHELNEILGNSHDFDTVKPVRLIQTLLSSVTRTNSDDLILDFFAGSGTTAHAVLSLNNLDRGNRKFICIQLPEPIDEKSGAIKLGFKTIADICKERIRRVLIKLNDEKQKKPNTLFAEENLDGEIDLGFKVLQLQPSNFRIWDAGITKTPEAIQAQLYSHIDHISPEAEQEAILFELLLKSGFPLTTSIQKMELDGKVVFSIAEGALLICLEKQLTNELIKAIANLQPQRVICLDEGFGNNDQLKTNAVQIMKSKKVLKFQTV